MIKSCYEKFFLPKLCNKCCSTKPINYQRNKVVPLANGLVLEIGIGSGLNIPFYDKNNIEKVIGLDPSEELNFLAKKIAVAFPIPDAAPVINIFLFINLSLLLLKLN